MSDSPIPGRRKYARTVVPWVDREAVDRRTAYGEDIDDPFTEGLPDLLQAPQLAILSVLDIALDITLDALATAHPELEDRDYGEGHPPAIYAADAILIQARGLLSALHEYRVALTTRQAPPSVPDPDF